MPHMTDQLPRFLKVSEVATIASVSEDTVHGWLAQGELRCYWAGKRKRVRLDELLDYLGRGAIVRPRASDDERVREILRKM